MTQERFVWAPVAQSVSLHKPVYIYNAGLMLEDGQEFGGFGYARVPAYFAMLAGFKIVNVLHVQFPTPLEDWGTAYFFLIHDTITGKRITSELTSPVFIPEGAVAIFQPGHLVIQIV